MDLKNRYEDFFELSLGVIATCIVILVPFHYGWNFVFAAAFDFVHPMDWPHSFGASCIISFFLCWNARNDIVEK